MKEWYERSNAVRWLVALVLLIGFAVLFGGPAFWIAAALGLDYGNPLHLGTVVVLQLVLLLPFWMLMANFFFAPLLRLAGSLRYYSPYLVVTRGRKGSRALHGATLFDYVLWFRWSERGPRAVRKILTWYVEGLLALAREMDQGNIPRDTVFSATSFIFSASLARRYGFRVEDGTRFSLGGLLTYPTQLLTYSFARGRWALPPVFRSKRATITGAALCAQVDRLQRLRSRLIRTQA
ncbi:MAG: hypothetical protein JNJ70_22885 [Verrucomicrobiales bacterium]|nr:hypothetical protein [Verrucomicrobiales bacterium]